MPKLSEKPLRKIVLRIFEEDYVKLKDLFDSNIGMNRAIRQIVHSFLNQTEAKIRKRIDTTEQEHSGGRQDHRDE